MSRCADVQLWIKALQLQQHSTQAALSTIVDYALFLSIAVIWSSSFLFIKVAVADIPPLSVAAGRIGIAALLLLSYLHLRGGRLPTDLSTWGKFAFIGLFGNSLPFFLIGFGEQTVDSGLAAILMGIMPIVTIVLAHLWIPDEPFDLRKGAGVALGFGGILVLVGVDALAGFGVSTIAQIAVLSGAVCYAVTTVFVRRTVDLPGPVMAAGSQVAGAAMIVPLALVLDHPWAVQPSPGSLACVVVLGVFPTALATLVYFRLVRNLGAGKLSQVNYLIPILGAMWGILFLGERLAASTLVALAMVLAGVAIVSRRRGASQRAPTEPSP